MTSGRADDNDNQQTTAIMWRRLRAAMRRLEERVLLRWLERELDAGRKPWR